MHSQITGKFVVKSPKEEFVHTTMVCMSHNHGSLLWPFSAKDFALLLQPEINGRLSALVTNTGPIILSWLSNLVCPLCFFLIKFSPLVGSRLRPSLSSTPYLFQEFHNLWIIRWVHDMRQQHTQHKNVLMLSHHFGFHYLQWWAIYILCFFSDSLSLSPQEKYI